MVKKLLLDVKSLWRCLCIELLICYVLLPLVNLYQLQDAPLQLTVAPVLFQAQLILPVAQALPIALLVQRYFSRGTAEVLHSLPAVCRSGQWSILLLEVLLNLLSLPVFFVYQRFFGMFFWQEWLRTMLQGFFLQNLAFAAVYLSHFPLAGMAALVLAVGGMQLPLLNVNAQGTLRQTINIFALLTNEVPRPWEPMRLLITGLCGAAFWYTGGRKMRYYLQ